MKTTFFWFASMARSYVIVILFVQAVGCTSPPDDEVMIETFQQNRASFEELLRVSRATQKSADGHVHLRQDTSPVVGTLMQRLGIRRIFGTTNRMFFVCTGLEHEFSGTKGYLFMPPEYDAPPDSEIVRTLDGIRLRTPIMRYRSLGEGWLLYVEGPDD